MVAELRDQLAVVSNRKVEVEAMLGVVNERAKKVEAEMKGDMQKLEKQLKLAGEAHRQMEQKVREEGAGVEQLQNALRNLQN